ncbi:MAG: hypothetical protein Barrevirus1_37 [Barrevirus sp.]|uniref:Uncharacterized protein n=1 Tax=Barrevirus sp. TaxID=2487763 RepID=A0A3G4ZPJ8_9VIRU|nr:MAG: hypothetical protein Barrevirus1_37 [Barrevirus sp.]
MTERPTKWCSNRYTRIRNNDCRTVLLADALIYERVPIEFIIIEINNYQKDFGMNETYVYLFEDSSDSLPLKN